MIGQIAHLGKVRLKLGISASLLYTAGIGLGATLLGATIAGAGYLLRWTFHLDHPEWSLRLLWLVAAAALLGGLRDFGILRFRLPQPYRQVPQVWMHIMGPRKTAFLWGLCIGLGYSTMVQYGLYYALCTAILVTASPVLGAMALGLYGVTQGGMLTAETFAIGSGMVGSAGILGLGRSDAFYRLSGFVLVGCACYLAAMLLRPL